MHKNTLLKGLAALAALTAALGCGEIKVIDNAADAGGNSTALGVAINLVSPSSGSIIGGTAVTLQGSGFDGDNTTVLINGRRALDAEVISKSTLVFRTPAASAPGPVEIKVFNSNGFGSLTDGFTYALVTELFSAEPRVGSPEGGETVTVSGVGFVDGDPGTNILRLGDQLLSPTIVDDATLTFVAPPGQLFTSNDISIENRNGSSIIESGYGYAKAGLLVADGQRQAGNLYFVDPATGEASVLRKLSTSVTGLVTTSDNRLLASTVAPSGIVELDLFAESEIDVVTGASGIPQIPDITELEDGRLLGVMRQTRSSVIVDLELGEMFQGPTALLNTPSGNGIAIAPDGKVYYARLGSGGMLESIQPDGTVVEEIQLVSGTNSQIMAMTFFEGELYIIRKGNPTAAPPPGGGGNQGATLGRINLGTGEITEIGPLPSSADALAVMPAFQ